GDTSATACDGFTWRDGNHDASGNFPYTFVGGNANGCDSTVTLHLIVNTATAGDTSATACDGFTWRDGNHDASGNFPYTFVGGNANGCDSTVTLHLTVNYRAETTVRDTANNSYQWHGNTYTESGTYQWIGSTEAGCDSVVTLLLVINHVGIQPVDEGANNVNVYPNPTTGWLTIDADNVLTVEVYDQTGRLIVTFKNTNCIDLSRQPSGNYTLKIQHAKGFSVQKVTVR
ncbi:MAG: T9SS type A sorting domain-containing protein, partial [bacterium]